MSLSCGYCDYDFEPGWTVWYDPGDYMELDTKRSRKCCSCGGKIAVGDVCSRVPRTKIPEYEVELKIYGEDGEAPLSNAYACERCTDIFWSLRDLGFECVYIAEGMPGLLSEYQETYGAGAKP